MTLSDKLVFLRKREGLSQMVIAEQLDVSRQAVSRWEAGTSKPSTENLQLLCKIYQVTMDYLLDDAAEVQDIEAATATLQSEPTGQHEKSITAGKKNSKKTLLCIIGIFVVIIVLILSVFVYTNSKKRPIRFSDLPLAPEEESQNPPIEFTIEW